MAKIRFLSYVLILFLALGTCGMALAGPPDFRGNWDGQWASTMSPGSSGALKATIYQSGTSLSGTISLYGTDCPGHPDFLDLPLHEGASIVGNEASFRVSAYCQDAYAEESMTEVKVSEGKMTGNYHELVDQHTNDRGTFELSNVTPAPVANFTAGFRSGARPLTVNFTDQSSGWINGRSWSFGDGATSTNQNPSHTYNTPGTYTVSLTINGPGESDTETKTDYITVEAGKAMPWLSLLLGDEAPTAYTLTVTAAPSMGGTVTKAPDQSTYAPGTNVALTAYPNTGYGFTGWSGDLTSTDNPVILTMDSNKNILANFAKAPILQTPSVSDTSVTLTWTFDGWPLYGTSGEGYSVEESTTSPSSGFNEIQYILGRASPESLSLTRTPGTYYYRVRAYKGTWTPYSEVKAAMVTAAARQLKITNYVGSQRLNQVVQVKIIPVGGTFTTSDLLTPDSDPCWDLFGDYIGPGESRTFEVTIGNDYWVFIGMGIWETWLVGLNHCPIEYPWHKFRFFTTPDFYTYYVWRTVSVTGHSSGIWEWTITGSYTGGNLYLNPTDNPSLPFFITDNDYWGNP